MNSFAAEFDEDDIEMEDEDDGSDASDFDEDLDPDKIEVPGEWEEEVNAIECFEGSTASSAC